MWFLSCGGKANRRTLVPVVKVSRVRAQTYRSVMSGADYQASERRCLPEEAR